MRWQGQFERGKDIINYYQTAYFSGGGGGNNVFAHTIYYWGGGVAITHPGSTPLVSSIRTVIYD